MIHLYCLLFVGNEVFSCEGSTLSIECSDDKVINIERANYGRTSPVPCNEEFESTQDWNLNCISNSAVNVVVNE